MTKKHPYSHRRLLKETSSLLINPNVLKKLYINFLASCNQLIRLVKCSAFCSLLLFLNKDINVQLPNNSDLIITQLIRQFNYEKERVQFYLLSTYIQIYLLLNLQTLPNNLIILGVIVTFISDDSVLESFILALRQVKGEYLRENISKYVIKVIQE